MCLLHAYSGDEEKFLNFIKTTEETQITEYRLIDELNGMVLSRKFLIDWSNQRGVGTGSLSIKGGNANGLLFSNIKNYLFILLIKTNKKDHSQLVINGLLIPFEKSYFRFDRAWKSGTQWDPESTIFGIETSNEKDVYSSATKVKSEFTFSIDLVNEQIIVLDSEKDEYYIPPYSLEY